MHLWIGVQVSYSTILATDDLTMSYKNEGLRKCMEIESDKHLMEMFTTFQISKVLNLFMEQRCAL